MKKQRTDIKRLAVIAAEKIPQCPGVPLVELAGDTRVLIENHQGVIAYEDTQICVRVKYGFVSIEGQCLVLSLMSRQQLVITGCINAVKLERRFG